MNARTLQKNTKPLVAATLFATWFVGSTGPIATAQRPGNAANQRRAPVPSVAPEQIQGIFFDNLSEAFSGERPTLSSIRSKSKAAAKNGMTGKANSDDTARTGSDQWSPLISAASIEDEVKQVRLRYDALITTPGRFNSGGYQTARVELTILATLFAVIAEYDGKVRWKKDANAARDLLGRTASNCKAGSTQVYNEAKLRKADLQDLVSGTGLAGRRGDPADDWSSVADRSPLMEYAEMLIEKLEDDGRSEKSIETNQDGIRRRSELLAMLGEVLTKEGLDGAGDDDYDQLSHSMSKAANEVAAAIERTDFESVRTGIGAIRSRCDSCHEEYR